MLRMLAGAACIASTRQAWAQGLSAGLKSSPADARRSILALFGPATPMADVSGRTDVAARFDARFRRYAEIHWRDHGAQWENANYYDRARIYYVFWARSGHGEYLNRAHAIVVNYRDLYLVANRYASSAHWAQMAGVFLHALLTDDPKSVEAVLRVSDTMSLPYYLDNLGKPDAEMDNRMQARVLTSLLAAPPCWPPGCAVRSARSSAPRPPTAPSASCRNAAA
jgi:hypothetical protein